MRRAPFFTHLVLLFSVLAPGRSWAQPAVDAKQLVHDVAVLAADSLEGRRTGTPGTAKARAYLISAFERIGVQSFWNRYEHPFRFESGQETWWEGVNVLGYLEGTARPDTFIVVTAHYDHLGVRHGEVYNGADDNASGVAGLLALASYFAEHPPRHSVLFAALDAEEVGLRGARALVQDPPVDRAAMRLNVNLDMISRSEEGVLYVAGTTHYPFLKPWLMPVTERSPLTVRFGHDQPGTTLDDWTHASDHAPFHEEGIPFLYFGVEDHPDYHRASDEYESIDPAFLAAAVQTILDAVRVLDTHLDVVLAEQVSPSNH